MLDLEKLLSKVKNKSKPSVDVTVETEGDDYSCGDRAIAAVKHGDGEAFEQAILDLLDKSK